MEKNWEQLNSTIKSCSLCDGLNKAALGPQNSPGYGYTESKSIFSPSAPFIDEHPLLRILTDRGTEYCDKAEQHNYQLYLAINDVDHTKTNSRSPQTNGICKLPQANFAGVLPGNIPEKTL